LRKCCARKNKQYRSAGQCGNPVTPTTTTTITSTNKIFQLLLLLLLLFLFQGDDEEEGRDDDDDDDDDDSVDGSNAEADDGTSLNDIIESMLAIFRARVR